MLLFTEESDRQRRKVFSRKTLEKESQLNSLQSAGYRLTASHPALLQVPVIRQEIQMRAATLLLQT